jgi:DNA-binding HxlR family transcriptional regulator/putative sterol carrier protein
MATRTYGQYCGLAHALELVGERWALLLVRDLIRGPKRFTDLQRGLPRIPTNVLSARLKELEQSGVVRRRILPRPASGVGYELTEYGRELEDVVLRLGLWGAKSMGEPRPEDTLNADSALLGLKALFRPEAARKLRASYELRMGEMVVGARIDRGTLTVEEGPLANPDLVLETEEPFRALLTGELTPGEAITSGRVKVTGDPQLLERFVEVFHLDVAQRDVAAESVA